MPALNAPFSPWGTAVMFCTAATSHSMQTSLREEILATILVVKSSKTNTFLPSVLPRISSKIKYFIRSRSTITEYLPVLPNYGKTLLGDGKNFSSYSGVRKRNFNKTVFSNALYSVPEILLGSWRTLLLEFVWQIDQTKPATSRWINSLKFFVGFVNTELY